MPHRRGIRRAQRIIEAWANDETDAYCVPDNFVRADSVPDDSVLADSVLVGAASGDSGDVEDAFDPAHS